MKLSKLDRKKFRVRNNLKKFSKDGRFRLCVSRSSKNISAQIIDDKKNITLVSASSTLKEIKSFRPPEPYKGKGIKEKGEYILRKEGKKK